jgi:hypothetical protein
VKRGGVGGRVFEAEEVLELAAGEEIFGLAGFAAIFEVRRDRALASPVDADRTLIRIGAEVFRRDVEDGGVVKPVLGGSAPVMSAILPMKFVSRNCANPEMPSGRMMPLMRNCTFACSLRT